GFVLKIAMMREDFDSKLPPARTGQIRSCAGRTAAASPPAPLSTGLYARQRQPEFTPIRRMDAGAERAAVGSRRPSGEGEGRQIEQAVALQLPAAVHRHCNPCLVACGYGPDPDGRPLSGDLQGRAEEASDGG